MCGLSKMICCLPHRLFLTVRSGKDGEVDAIVYRHITGSAKGVTVIVIAFFFYEHKK